MAGLGCRPPIERFQYKLEARLDRCQRTNLVGAGLDGVAVMVDRTPACRRTMYSTCRWFERQLPLVRNSLTNPPSIGSSLGPTPPRRTSSEIALPTWQLFVSRDSECDHCRDRQNNERKQGEAESDPLLSPPPSGRCPCSLGCHLQRRLSISRTTTTSHASNSRPLGRSSPGTFVLAPECRRYPGAGAR